MTDTKTYKLKGHTVKVVPDTGCSGCVFEGHYRCPTEFDERKAGIGQTCIEGNHKYVKVQETGG